MKPRTLPCASARCKPTSRTAQFGPQNPQHMNAVLSHHFGGFSVFAPRLGNIGTAALEPFETIIDYTHQRLILIRLDAAGHRLAKVPAYTPAQTVPLATYDKYWWGVQGVLGDVTDSLEIDTGNPGNSMLETTRRQVAAHLVPAAAGAMGNVTLDHLKVGSRTFDAVSFTIGNDDSDVFSFGFLSRLGVVGFNFRTRQLILYH